ATLLRSEMSSRRLNCSNCIRSTSQPGQLQGYRMGRGRGRPAIHDAPSGWICTTLLGRTRDWFEFNAPVRAGLKNVVPGFMNAADHRIRQGIQSYVIGLALAACSHWLHLAIVVEVVERDARFAREIYQRYGKNPESDDKKHSNPVLMPHIIECAHECHYHQQRRDDCAHYGEQYGAVQEPCTAFQAGNVQLKMRFRCVIVSNRVQCL